jgi:UDP-galactopyranose mutase
MKYDYLIVGAGLSGSVLAERLATVNNKKILVIDKRDHIGGNCYDYIDENGILINKYGAHLFHTNKVDVWDYIQKFSNWVRWDHKVQSYVDNQFVPVPVNINTINALCDANIKDEKEADEWLANTQVKYDIPIVNSEQMAKSRVGDVLYEKMFKPYTIKQWAKSPSELNKSVLARIPIRNNFDDRYFSDRYQALPEKGYTQFIQNILNHPNITIKLNTDYVNLTNNTNASNASNATNASNINDYDKIEYDFIIYTGQIDAYFSNKMEGLEKLEYRSIDFQIEYIKNMNYYQPVSVVNYPGLDVPFTRIVEYKHFLNQSSPHTTIVKEITTDIGEPYYPVLTDRNLELYEKYRQLSENELNVHFIGRLANYKYFNMDEAIKNSLDYFMDKFMDKTIIVNDK